MAAYAARQRQMRQVDDFRLDSAVSPALQLRTLSCIFRAVREGAAAGMRPLVEVDLDLTSIMPSYRTRRALKLASEALNIELIPEREKETLLPGYSDEAWLQFVQKAGLERRFPTTLWRDTLNGPNRDPGSPFSIFHEAYWTVEWMAEDTPTPGLGGFVARIRETGGEVVFLSGRWLEAHIPPTYKVLERAGVSDPQLVSGNPRHPTLVPAAEALSDAEIKAQHQRKVRALGNPVAILDDRIANRDAVMRENTAHMLSVAVAIPGFTHDPATDREPFRLSTFEGFDLVLGDPPVRSFMLDRYGAIGVGQPWRGQYEGTGLNKMPYVLPRALRPEALGEATRYFAQMLQQHSPGSLAEEAMLRFATATIPPAIVHRVEECLREACLMAVKGMGASMPESAEDQERVKLVLLTSWLHSRDIEYMMLALGYKVITTGLHDLEEYVLSDEIKVRIGEAHSAGKSYSEWVLRWVESLPAGEMINVGCFNAALTVSMYEWKPNATNQDAMDIHRLSAHHTGDAMERYDPVEAAVNNVLHQREGLYGIRKEPVVSWIRMAEVAERHTDAEDLARSSAGRQALEDAIEIGKKLERVGALTPWGLVVGASFED